MSKKCSLFPDKQEYCTAIYAVKQTVSSLELIGSIFIIFIIWLFKKYKYFDQRLIMALGVSALGQSISLMLTDVPQERGHFCRFQAWIITYFENRVLKCHFVCVDRYYHFISWGVPFVVSCLPLIADAYGPAGPW
ncbi:hypothetical protein P5673_000947 [Acropora cervicornis]|uniref:Uncharacterized protein n=1 Tax=Acropora cervicornis TaxID=6130 RepID=A0AAD9VG75_ACRCE|nr:hypothetical protein P5673_000947 [Acropora cervicornis]